MSQADSQKYNDWVVTVVMLVCALYDALAALRMCACFDIYVFEKTSVLGCTHYSLLKHAI